MGDNGSTPDPKKNWWLQNASDPKNVQLYPALFSSGADKDEPDLLATRRVSPWRSLGFGWKSCFGKDGWWDHKHISSVIQRSNPLQTILISGGYLMDICRVTAPWLLGSENAWVFLPWAGFGPRWISRQPLGGTWRKPIGEVSCYGRANWWTEKWLRLWVSLSLSLSPSLSNSNSLCHLLSVSLYLSLCLSICLPIYL